MVKVEIYMMLMQKDMYLVTFRVTLETPDVIAKNAYSSTGITSFNVKTKPKHVNNTDPIRLRYHFKELSSMIPLVLYLIN